MIANNRAKWEAEYPSDSPTITVLREAVIRAEALSLDSQSAFDGLHEILAETEIPPHEWPDKLYQCFQTLKRADAADARHLARALRALQTAFAAHQSAAKRPPQPQPDPPYIPPPPALDQAVLIKVENGQLRHKFTLDIAALGGLNYIARHGCVRRYFTFKDLVVPEPYAWILTHNGFTCTETCTDYAITYSTEEFAKIWLCEQASGSGLLLDGPRRDYRSAEFRTVEYAQAKRYAGFEAPWEGCWNW
jgi:hypothetical protein